MGAWAVRSAGNPCIVLTFAARPTGSAVWVAGAVPGRGWSAKAFQDRFGGNWCLPQCSGCTPDSAAPPPPPTTGPQPPSEGETIPPSASAVPPKKCGDDGVGMAVRYNHRGGWGTEAHLGEPQVGMFTASALRQPGGVTRGGVQEKRTTNPAEVRRDANGLVKVYHKATGPGVIVFHPPELIDRKHFRNTRLWPDETSSSSLLFLSGLDADEQRRVRQMLTFGLLHEEKELPRSGAALDYEPENARLVVHYTDADAEITSTVPLVAGSGSGNVNTSDSLDIGAVIIGAGGTDVLASPTTIDELAKLTDLDDKLDLSGGEMSGDIDMDGNNLLDVGTINGLGVDRYYRRATDFVTTAGSSPAGVAGSVLAVDTGVYEVEVIAHIGADDNANQVRFGIEPTDFGGATLGVVAVSHERIQTATPQHFGWVSSMFRNWGGGFDTDDATVRIQGTFEVTSAGDVGLEFFRSGGSGSDEVTLGAGSFYRLRKIG